MSVILEGNQAVRRQSLERVDCVILKEIQAVPRQSWKRVVSEPSGPMTKSGASRFGDSRRETSGSKTKLGRGHETWGKR